MHICSGSMERILASIYVLKGDGKGKQFELSPGDNIAGRNRSCAIRFNDIEVSRQHILLKLTDDGLFVVDLDSANGSFLNGKQLDRETRLQSGDRLMIGQTLLLVNLAPTSIVPGSARALGSGVLPGTNDSRGDEISLDSHEVIKSMRENLDFLYSATLTASNAEETEGMLERLLNLVFEWIDVDRGSVLLWDNATEEFLPRFLKQRSQARTGPIQFSRTIIDYVRENGQGILTDNASNDSRWACQGSIVLDGIQEVICVPIRGRAEIYGLFYVDTVAGRSSEIRPAESVFAVESGSGSGLVLGDPVADRSRLNNDHLKLMVTIAHHAAIVIENREFNEAVVASERLTAVGQTLSAMSHHIKNILQGINCGEHLVKDGIQESRMDAIKTGWDIVRRNQHEMSLLVMDMLVVSNKTPPHLRLGDVCRSVSRAVEDAQQEGARVGIDIRFTMPDHATRARIDPEMITRAVSSVFNFYVSSTTENPEAVPDGDGTRSTIRVAIEEHGDLIQIVIVDNFVNASDYDLPTLFDLLTYARNEKHVRGISLPVCEKIIKEHAGSVSVEAVDDGLRFELSIPGDTAPSEENTGYFRRPE